MKKSMKKSLTVAISLAIFFLPNLVSAEASVNTNPNERIFFKHPDPQAEFSAKMQRRSNRARKKISPDIIEKIKKIEPPNIQNPPEIETPSEFWEMEIAPGLIEKIYTHSTRGDRVKAYCLIADHDRYELTPMLALGKVQGRATVSDMYRDFNAWSDNSAVGAINASYFAVTGDLIGVTKIDGLAAGTTYFERSAIGIMPDGTAVFGKNYYDGHVTLGDMTLPVSGVNHERSDNNLIIYNRWYGESTRTNEFGLEFVIENGYVTAINQNNSRIPADGIVVSVHGTAKDAFMNVKIGDRAIISEDFGNPWNDAIHIVGAGPRLVSSGMVYVTADEEEFPSDIRIGRAPRSAVGVTSDGDFLIAVVDGRQSLSRGCTLTEWAQLLIDFGAVDAINLDGGGSSALVINGELMNSPSDGRERLVGSSIIISRKPN